MRIGRRRIGEGQPLFVIAEIGLNHGGAPDRAIALVDAAVAAGCSAVKVQSLVASGLVSPACPPPAHVEAESLQAFFAGFELDEVAHRAIASAARRHGLPFIATPLSLDAVEMLERVGVDAYKIASGDLTWTELIERCARTGRPLILSSGMATLDEVAHALTRARLAGATDIALLHCVSAYPVPAGSENLRAIATLAARFDVPIGLSDHASDTSAVPIAIALGASLYERHIVLAHGDGSVDDAVSSTASELASVVSAAARTHAAMGHGDKVCLPAEAINAGPSRRGLYATRALPAGHVVTAGDIAILRPRSELAPDRQGDVIGITLTRSIDVGEPFGEQDLVAHRTVAVKGQRGIA